MFRVYFDLAKCFETIDGNRGGAIEMGAPREKRVSPQCDNSRSIFEVEASIGRGGHDDTK